MKLDNPFLIRGYAGPSYFCDRTEETQKLVSAISNGRDVTLVAPRSYGKTGLIHNALQILDKTHAEVGRSPSFHHARCHSVAFDLALDGKT